MQLNRRQALSSIGTYLSLSTLSVATLSLPLHAGPRNPGVELDFLGAVQRGDLERVRRLLAQEPGLARTKDAQGRSAFVLAHLKGHTAMAELLREHGLELDLVEAVLAEDWERFGALAVSHPEQLNQAHPIGGTPMYAAALVGSHGFWRLRGAGCMPDLAPAGGSGFTAARAALESERASWARISLCDLGGNGSSLNAPQRHGSSVLHRCVERRDAMLVKLAIRKGADVTARDDAGRTPLALAAHMDWAEGEALLESHAELPRDNRASRFALDANRQPVVRADLEDVPQARQSQVTSSSHFKLAEVKRFLAEDKRLTFSISTDDELAIEASAHLGNRPLMRLHLDHGAPLSLPTAVSLGDQAMVRYWLVRDPTLIHERGAHDFPVMWYALLGGASVEMAELLVSHGASVDQESMGTTTLHLCARRGALELAEFLLQSGCDAEAMGYKYDREGETPLQRAEREGQGKLVALLKREGAKR